MSHATAHNFTVPVSQVSGSKSPLLSKLYKIGQIVPF
jgi:hypothetical protein